MDVDPRPRLDPGRLRDLVRELSPPYDVSVVDATPSTNAELAERAQDGAADRLVLVAEHQTSGRGRLDRGWESPSRAGLTFSVLLRPDLEPEAWPWLPLLTGYAVGRALRGLGVPAGLKWPNDVLVGDRKLAGILVERLETPRGPAAVVGVGVNVTTTRDELPVPGATSLVVETGRDWDRTALLGSLLAALTEEYAAWRAPGGAPGLWRAYTAACVTLGRQVMASLPDGGRLAGQAVEIDESGRLVVSTPAGSVRLSAGDVTHVRDGSRG